MSSKSRLIRAYQLVVLGSGAVGKSALTIQFIQGKFVDKWDPTIEYAYHKPYMIGGEEIVMLNVLDTAGGKEYQSLRDSYINRGEGFLLVYSVTSRTSFEELRSFYQQIMQVKDQYTIPIVLVANKCDLEYKRQVSRNEGRDLASLFGCPLIETSAKLRINIDEAFGACVRAIRRQNAELKHWKSVSTKFEFTEQRPEAIRKQNKDLRRKKSVSTKFEYTEQDSEHLSGCFSDSGGSSCVVL
ncbi:ras family-domain-containing protein [Collybia nuda]|uniref:small monomeric GTPase n=1 Tax=Collybia nuda TaxID=64659 RepID=A0A9P6CF84_9AGAR|nr:ras family-domain-containing protein [Collybia nuda]